MFVFETDLYYAEQFSFSTRQKNENKTALTFKQWPGTGPNLPIGCVGLSLGPQDSMGPPTNCGTGTHRINWL